MSYSIASYFSPEDLQFMPLIIKMRSIIQTLRGCLQGKWIGVHDNPKISRKSWAEIQLLYWDSSLYSLDQQFKISSIPPAESTFNWNFLHSCCRLVF